MGKHTKKNADGVILCDELPKKPQKGKIYRVETPKGITDFEATGEKGFGKFIIRSNRKKVDL